MKDRILLVEDEELLSSAFSTILDKAGYNVRVAKNGKQALEIIPDFEPAIIFLDLLMPEMGGVEFLKNYKSPGGSKPHIVVLSNLHDQDIIEEVERLGAKKYVVKSQLTPSFMTDLTKGLLTS